jgi:sugar phosphate isomerase/epimerase
VRLGVSGTVLPDDLRALTPEIAQTIKAWGYTGVFTRFRANHPLRTSPDDCRRVRDLLAEHQLDHVMATGFWQCLIHPEPDTRARAVEILQGALRLAGALGAQAIDTGPGSLSDNGPWAPHPDNWRPWAEENLIDSLRQAAPVAEEAGVRIHLEGHQLVVLRDPETARRVIDATESPWVKLDIDPVNWITLQTYYDTAAAIDAMFDTLGERIGSGHSKDVVLWDRHTLHLDTVMTGEGLIDHGRYLQRLQALDPDIYLVVEHCPPEEAANVHTFLRREAEAAGVEIH